MSSPSATAMPSEPPDLAVRPALVTQPGLAIHVGAELDPRGHLLVAFTGHSDRALPHGDGPPEVSWSLYDGALPLAQVAALLAVLPPTARITPVVPATLVETGSVIHGGRPYRT
jgi:hypothetical protein